MDLPVFFAEIDDSEDSGITFVSLVDEPAIKKDFLYFNEKQKYSIQSEEKRIVTGAAMLADYPIYRSDEQRGEYYLMFTSESIFKIAKKFAREGKYESVNKMHSEEVDGGMHLLESFFINRERGIMPPKGFEDVKDGSWFMTYLVDNDEIWSQVKEGKFKGFSVEGAFSIEEPNKKEVNELAEEIYSLLKKFNTQTV